MFRFLVGLSTATKTALVLIKMTSTEQQPEKRQRQRMKVMENSGQTDAERRSLRQSLRNLNKDIQNKADELEDANSEAFTNMRSKSNALWNQVKYTREAVLDGDNLEFLATRAARQVDKLVEVSTLYMHVLVFDDDDAVDTVDVAPADVIADHNTDHNTHTQISNHTNTHTHTNTTGPSLRCGSLFKQAQTKAIYQRRL